MANSIGKKITLGICNQCDTVSEITNDDLFMNYEHNSGGRLSFKCPHCGFNQSVDGETVFDNHYIEAIKIELTGQPIQYIPLKQED